MTTHADVPSRDGQVRSRGARAAEAGPIWLAGGPRRLRRRWTWWVSLGELLGFAAPAAVGVLTAASSPVLAAIALVAAGAVEGLLLGTFQAMVLDRELLGFSRRSWTAATVVGAALGWALGVLPTTTYALWVGWPLTVTVPLGLLLGFVLLTSVGGAQWWVLRRHVGRAWRWVVGSAVGWAAGLGVFTLLAVPLWHPGQGPATVATIGAVAGLAMAATMAWVTGLTLVRLLSRPGADRVPPRLVPLADWQQLAASTDHFRVFDPCMVEDLPTAVQRWLLHAITPGSPLLTTVDVRTDGHLRLGSTWRPCRSTERLSLTDGFLWAARVGLAGLPVWGYDHYLRGTGGMEWRVLGRLPLLCADDESVTRSAAGRHAAEVLSLLPAAALSPSVRWKGIDDNRAVATLCPDTQGEPQRVTIVVGPNGALRQLLMDRWGTPPDAGYGRHRFGAKFEGEGYFDGYRVPTQVTVGWHPGSDRWEQGRFLRYRLTGARFR